MTFALHGVGVSNGIAIGRVHLIRRDQLDIREYEVALPDIENEVRRFNNAVTIARQQRRAVRDHIPGDTAEDISAFIDTHLLMLEDSALIQEPANIIEQHRCNAEWALQLQRDSLVNVFEAMDDAYLRTRKDDVDHVVSRIQRVLLNQSPLRHEQPDSRLRGYIVLADDLSPADTVLMDHHGITAFATDTGGPTSHTAILARSLGIPGIVGLHAATRYISEDEEVIIDGKQGVVIVDPDERTLEYYRGRQQARIDYLRELRKLRGTAAVSLDDQPVTLMANVELPADINAVTDVGADGIGLYRTEYLYMNRPEFPDEEEQFERYRAIVETMEGRPLTIRTLDVGADKEVDSRHTNANEEANPALGLRGLRLCLKEPDIFKPQLRAVLRASAFGRVRLMVPMLSTIEEARQVKKLLQSLQQELEGQGLAFDPGMPLGAMIEVPAAAICAEAFAAELDFLSIGTNDLIQYAIAIDRVNVEVNYLYDPLHAGVLRLISGVIDAGARHGVTVSMCGEMAGDPRMTRLLLGLGLREFSVHPAVLLELKRIINGTDIASIATPARGLLEVLDYADVAEAIHAINQGSDVPALS